MTQNTVESICKSKKIGDSIITPHRTERWTKIIDRYALRVRVGSCRKGDNLHRKLAPSPYVRATRFRWDGSNWRSNRRSAPSMELTSPREEYSISGGRAMEYVGMWLDNSYRRGTIMGQTQASTSCWCHGQFPRSCQGGE